MVKRILFLVSFVFYLSSNTLAQSNGKLQIHFMDVGQGDGTLLISPLGETVLFDNGARGNCDKPLSYLQQLGVTKIDYHIASHYHTDHIGCTSQVLSEFPLQKTAYDRGGTYPSSTFDSYVSKVGSKRQTATKSTVVTLDGSSAKPVRVNFVALNGNGIATDNENDLSLVAVVHYGNFEAVIGGDLSGFKSENYEDIETSVAPDVGQVEVYKVHHHGSRYSSNSNWLNTIKPMIGIISTGNGNTYGHPTIECLERLHKAGVKTYWTETGNGADPEPGYAIVGHNIVVEVAPTATSFSVTYNDTHVDNYPFWGETPVVVPKYAWSKKSDKYHYTNCEYVKNISAANLENGDTPPQGKILHNGCPK